MEPKRLYRSRRDRMIAGVCGGIAAYLGVDPLVIRIIAFFMLLPGGVPGLFPYLVLWFFMPEEPA